MSSRWATRAARLALVFTAVPLLGQEQHPPLPSFPSDVELVAVDVNVVDGDGNPIRGLAPESFFVKVDGQPRRVLSVQFVEAPAGAAAPGEATAPAAGAAEVVRDAGRSVVFVVDRGQVSL